jgi:hypothetical protein|tara:strand:- start:43 stop:726 length:684 start_codon:yes stop_codon:yes gene_type:complete
MGTLFVDKLDPQSGTSLELGSSGDTITVPTGAGLTVTDEVKTNKISPASGTAFTLGDSGDTFTIPSGATITNSGTATGFGGIAGTNRFSARRSGNQSSISSDTFTKINITTEIEDPDGVYDASNSRFTAPAAGTYFFTAKTYCWGNIQKISGSFAVNGSATSTAGYDSHVILDGDFSNSGHQFTAHSTHIYVLSQNDYVEFWVKATLHSGSMVSDEVGTHFAGFRIA